MKVPNNHRILNGPMASDNTYGNNGAFMIPLSGRTVAYIIASDKEGWEHVSVHCVSDGKPRTPTWAEMCKIKEYFWDDTETVVQFHPKRSEYVNWHKHTLHLWKPVEKEIELPQNDLV